MAPKSKNILVIAASLLFLGCEREDPIQSYSAPKDPPRADFTRAGGASGANPHAASAATPQWTLPEGWKQLDQSGQMRYASIAVTSDESVQLAVAMLPKQELVANINRWEGQVSLPHTPADKINDVVMHMDGQDGLHFDVVELKGTKPNNGPAHQMLAAMLDHAGRTWTFKLEGPPDIVAPQKEKFIAFLKSVRFGAAAPAPAQARAQSSTPPTPPSAGGGMKIANLTLPSDWREDPTPRPMREKTLFIGNTNPATEVIISRFPKMNFDQMLAMNIDRWRGQVGLPPAKPDEIAKLTPPSIRLGGNDGKLYEFVGPQMRQLVAMSWVGEELWFVRIIGPGDTMTQQRPAIEAFLASIQFAKE